jgi:hypothetical protein
MSSRGDYYHDDHHLPHDGLPVGRGFIFFIINLLCPRGFVAGSHNISPVGQWALHSELGLCYPGCYPNKTEIEAKSPGDHLKITAGAILLPKCCPK